MKKFLLLLTILIVLANCFCLGACQTNDAQGIEFEVLKIGKASVSGYNGTDSDVTIPSRYKFLTVTNIGTEAFGDCKTLTSITIPNSVTTIGPAAFWYCPNLSKVTLGTNVKSIAASAFAGCTSLTTINLPKGITTIEESAFYDCISLTSIVIPNSVTNMETWVFIDCPNLTIYCEATSQPSGWIRDWEDRCPVYWYSETQPTTSGNYWHYVDGVVTKW